MSFRRARALPARAHTHARLSVACTYAYTARLTLVTGPCASTLCCIRGSWSSPYQRAHHARRACSCASVRAASRIPSPPTLIPLRFPMPHKHTATSISVAYAPHSSRAPAFVRVPFFLQGTLTSRRRTRLLLRSSCVSRHRSRRRAARAVTVDKCSRGAMGCLTLPST